MPSEQPRVPFDTADRDRAYGANRGLGLLAYEVAESGKKETSILALSAAFMLICLSLFVGLAVMAMG
jgi:hypothetical protein